MGFNLLFWGFLFQFDFRINGFDILPDFIGYFFIYLGLVKLENSSSFFRSAKKMAFPLIFLSMPGLIEVKLQGSFSLWMLIAVLVGIVVVIMDLIMVFNIFQGIGEMARSRNHTELFYKSGRRWGLYLVMTVLSCLGVFMAWLFNPIAVVLVIPFFIFSLIVFVLILAFIKEAERAL